MVKKDKSTNPPNPVLDALLANPIKAQKPPTPAQKAAATDGAKAQAKTDPSQFPDVQVARADEGFQAFMRALMLENAYDVAHPFDGDTPELPPTPVAVIGNTVFTSVQQVDKGIDRLSTISRIARGHGNESNVGSLNFSGYTLNAPAWTNFSIPSVRVDKNLVLDGSFTQNFNIVLASEGGFANNAPDRGGKTIYGISSVHNPREYAQIMSQLNRGDTHGAMEMTMTTYRRKYWDAIPGIDRLSNSAKLVAFDAAINHGVGFARKMLDSVGDNVDAMINYRANAYRHIIANDASQSVFANGWGHRLAKLDAIADNQPLQVASAAPKVAGPTRTLELH